MIDWERIERDTQRAIIWYRRDLAISHGSDWRPSADELRIPENAKNSQTRNPSNPRSRRLNTPVDTLTQV